MYLPGCGQIQVSYYGVHDQAPTSTPEEALLLINNSIRSRVEKFLHSHGIETWEDLENLNWATIEHHNYGPKTHEALRQAAPIDIPQYKDLEKISRKYWVWSKNQPTI